MTGSPEPAIFCLGKFDAMHLGHRALVDAAASVGAARLTVFRGIARELGWAQRLPLCDDAERGRVLATWNSDAAFVELDFARLRRLEPAAFVDHLRDEAGAGGVVCGANFRFGFQRRGDAAALSLLAEERGLFAAVVPTVHLAGGPVASSRIREDLAAGAVESVAELLGRPYRLVGEVVAGAGRGSGIGFPTANCARLRNQPPGRGVYAARATLDRGEVLAAAVNVGTRPTVDGGEEVVEAHLLDWEGDARGRELRLDFVARLRDERRFPDVDALARQLAEDVAACRGRLAATGMGGGRG